MRFFAIRPKINIRRAFVQIRRLQNIRSLDFWTVDRLGGSRKSVKMRLQCFGKKIILPINRDGHSTIIEYRRSRWIRFEILLNSSWFFLVLYFSSLFHELFGPVLFFTETEYSSLFFFSTQYLCWMCDLRACRLNNGHKMKERWNDEMNIIASTWRLWLSWEKSIFVFLLYLRPHSMPYTYTHTMENENTAAIKLFTR